MPMKLGFTLVKLIDLVSYDLKGENHSEVGSTGRVIVNRHRAVVREPSRLIAESETKLGERVTGKTTNEDHNARLLVGDRRDLFLPKIKEKRTGTSVKKRNMRTRVRKTSVDMKRIKSKSKDMKNLIDHGHEIMDKKSWTGKLKQGNV
ncbi:hypothetical protein DY000_02051789 [Brassica cretica]|uniref:Uncharacterized protein n=1 Tax=Brassica cretica TaxID=69181 RepID=A0ABQ7A8N3_BRACR|nr:hypothetical protein DY000_02051789 [Brassica cretica]